MYIIGAINTDNYQADNYRSDIRNYDVIPINPITVLIVPIIYNIFLGKKKEKNTAVWVDWDEGRLFFTRLLPFCQYCGISGIGRGEFFTNPALPNSCLAVK